MKEEQCENTVLLYPAYCSIIILCAPCFDQRSGQHSSNGMVFVILLFIAAFMLNKNKWWGSLFGVIVGVALVWMSFQYTGQPIDIERPIGIVLCLFYAICGTISFLTSK